MGRDDHPLDLEFLANELWAFMPPPLRLILQHYLSLHADATTALVLPSEAASYLALEHPRIKGSAQLGIKSHDRITVLPNSLSPEQLAKQMPSDATNLIAFFHSDTLDGDTDGIVTIEQRAEACLTTVVAGTSVDFVVPAALVQTDAGAGMRELLLARGQVTDLFDGGTYWYVGWLGEPPDAGHRTQVVEVPPPDEWSDFAEDLVTWMPLWRWGDLALLPETGPWNWNSLHPDLVSMLLRQRAEIEGATTATSAATLAHATLTFIELALRYLVEMRVGDDATRILPSVRPAAREQAEKALARGGRQSVLGHLNFINFKQVVDAEWPLFAPVFDADFERKRFFRELDHANDIRNRTAHPSKLIRVTSEDLALLNAISSKLDKAIERAENLAGR